MPVERIFLMGMPGSGKSTWGKWLAQQLGWKFLDLDKQIVSRTQRSISELFSETGEDNFRLLERELLHETFTYRQTVISCGGGTPAFFDNMHQMLMHGLTIYLKAEPGLLINRIVFGKTSRPLFKGLPEEEIGTRMEALLKVRSPYYEQAECTIMIGEDSREVLKNMALAKISKSC